jgi:ABC-type sugar transport system ATPase subunit
MARIELRKVCKTLSDAGTSGFLGLGPPGTKTAASTFHIQDLDLEVPDGTVLAVLGPSGCGKSTLLRLIAGLLPADAGEVLFDGQDMRGVHPGQRKIGIVFQNYALYPHYDSRSNVLSYFLFRKKTPALEEEKRQRYQRTAELLGVELEALLDRMPRTLSGGEKQRVAIARCITRDPRLFLLDEPFSNLDQKLREKYRVQLRRLLKQFGITTVYVTHDQIEALVLADQIALMRDGRIEQVGTAREIYDAPRNLFAADFLGFEPETVALNVVDGANVSAELAPFTIGFRPEGTYVGPAAGGAPPGSLVLRGEVLDLRDMSLRGHCLLCLRAAGAEIYVRIERGPSHAVGQTVTVAIPRYHLFDKASGERVETRS